MTYIYVIGTDAGPYKVGVSKSPEQRLAAIQTGNSGSLKIHHLREVADDEGFAFEAHAHFQLSRSALRGEWFAASKEDVILAVERARPGRFDPQPDAADQIALGSGYIGVIHQSGGGTYGLSFPDIPGCVTAADDLRSILPHAEEALSLHLRGLLEDGGALPTPSGLDDIAIAFAGERVAFAMVPVASSRSVRVNITMPEETLKAVDRYAEDHGFTRSGLIAQAVKRVLEDA